MSHLESFRAIHYRGIDGLHLERIAAVNLITGPNGAGKTSLAEAIWLFNGRFTPTLPWNANVQRSQRSMLDALAHLADNGVVELAGIERGEAHEWKAMFERVPVAGSSAADSDQQTAAPPKPPAANGPGWPVSPQGRLRVWLDGREVESESRVPAEVAGGGAFFIGPAVERPADHRPGVIHLPVFSLDMDEETINRFSALVRQGRKKEVKSRLRFLAPPLDDVEVITDENGKPLVLATTADERLPLQALGGGMTRLFRVFVSFLHVQGGLVVVDEIENGLHHSVLPDLWRQVRGMTRDLDVQVFATTHSQECIEAAIESFSAEADRLAVHVLARHDGQVRVATYSGETLEAARDLHLDLR